MFPSLMAAVRFSMLRRALLSVLRAARSSFVRVGLRGAATDGTWETQASADFIKLVAESARRVHTGIPIWILVAWVVTRP